MTVLMDLGWIMPRIILDNKPTLTRFVPGILVAPGSNVQKQVNPMVTYVAEQANWADYGFDYLEKAGADRVFAFGLAQAILSLINSRSLPAPTQQ